MKPASQSGIYKRQLEILYKKYAPDKVANIPTLLKKWQGREKKLIENVKKKYIGEGESQETKKSIARSGSSSTTTKAATPRPSTSGSSGTSNESKPTVASKTGSLARPASASVTKRYEETVRKTTQAPCYVAPYGWEWCLPILIHSLLIGPKRLSC